MLNSLFSDAAALDAYQTPPHPQMRQRAAQASASETQRVDHVVIQSNAPTASPTGDNPRLSTPIKTFV
jgi:hypothetical protein